MILRILTYNIHKCIGGTDRRYDPDRVRETIAHYHPDLVLMQEVDHGARRSNGDRQVDLLGDMLDLRHRIWFPNVRLRKGGEYGNAILSRFPLTETANIDLTVAPKKRRSVLHARCRIRLGKGGSRTMHIYNPVSYTHLTLPTIYFVYISLVALPSNKYHHLLAIDVFADITLYV